MSTNAAMNHMNVTNGRMARAPARAQRGLVLVTTLLLLLVVTLLAIAMFRSVGIENLIAGNVLDKQHALQAADAAQNYAEQWLSANAVTTVPIDCGLNPGATSALVICSKPLSTELAGGDVATVPWAIGGDPSVGYQYNPGQMLAITTDTTGNTKPTPNDVSGLPLAYVSFLGTDGTDVNAKDYLVDAWAYGGSVATVAVVQSTYQIRYKSLPPGP